MAYQTVSPPELDSVWSKYGLKESPYSTSPMRLLSILPIQKVFSGRKEEVSLLKKSIKSKNSSRDLIVGDFGIGKTTLANYVKWELAIKKDGANYLTTSSEIKIQPNWDAITFLISTLSSIYTASIVFDWKSKGINTAKIQKLKEYVSINKLKSYHGNLAGMGGGYSITQGNPPIISPEILENLLYDVCSDLLSQGKQIIVLYNNLENVELNKLGEIFRSIRDYLQIEGFHSLFLGPPSVISALEAYGQVHSTFGRPHILKPLTEENVLEILQKRCEALKIEEGRYIKPYDESTVRELYLKLNKNIRFTFKVLEDATLYFEPKAPCEITMLDIVAVQEKEKKEILSSLTETQLRIVSALLAHKELNQTDLSTITKIGITNLTTPVRELLERGLITEKKDKEDKRIKYVRLSDNSYLKLFFETKKSNENINDIQKRLEKTK